MQELIKITQDLNGNNLVSARELHTFLEVDTAFRHWAVRMFEYGFTESIDYTPFNFEHPQNKQELIDYALTIDCAKEIAMIQRTEKGKQARQYFIECERIARNPVMKQLTRLEMAKMILETETRNEQLQLTNDLQSKELKAAAPKVKYVDEVLQADNAHVTTIIAKELGMSAKELNNVLNGKGIIYKQNDTWVLYSRYQNKGYTRTKTTTFTDSTGKTRTNILTVWTELGRAFIHNAISPLR